MRILIISSGRAGSNSLSIGLHNSLLNHKLVLEPFNDYYSKPEFSLTDPNLIVKTLSFQAPLPVFNFLNLDLIKKQTIDILYDYSFYFEKIILLGRKDKSSVAKSWKKIFEDRVKGMKNTWNTISNYDNLTENEFLSHIEYSTSILNNLSKILNIPLTYYEDIFSENKKNINNFLNATNLKLNSPENLYKILNPKNRYLK